ncbi:MAG: HAD family phosphatase [Cytophagales bacterium]|nr:HAD family phosphatase [Cytophagales bacterium]
MKEFTPANYDTVIFDLGEVIIDLGPQAVEDRLFAASRKALDYKDLVFSSPIMQRYETGKISESEFRKGVMEILSVSFTEEQFDEIWNLMLHHISMDRVNLMEQLKSNYQVMILSNTNPIHERKFDAIVRERSGGRKLSDFVHHAHYSHILGMRKPDEEIYRHVIDMHQLQPERTLFLDDRLDNVEGARATGITAVQVRYPDQIFEILQDGRK